MTKDEEEQDSVAIRNRKSSICRVCFIALGFIPYKDSDYYESVTMFQSETSIGRRIPGAAACERHTLHPNMFGEEPEAENFVICKKLVTFVMDNRLRPRL